MDGVNVRALWGPDERIGGAEQSDDGYAARGREVGNAGIVPDKEPRCGKPLCKIVQIFDFYSTFERLFRTCAPGNLLEQTR